MITKNKIIISNNFTIIAKDKIGAKRFRERRERELVRFNTQSVSNLGSVSNNNDDRRLEYANVEWWEWMVEQGRWWLCFDVFSQHYLKAE